jgi:uncharacterized membrane protein
MILAATTDTPYRILLILHFLAVIIAFAPAFMHPVLQSQLRGEGARGKALSYMASNSMRIHGSALVIAGILGFGLAGMSDKVYKMSQGWLVGAFIVWIAMNGILHGLVVPAEKRLATGDDSQDGKLAIGGGAMTLLLVVMMYLMVFKPGQ